MAPPYCGWARLLPAAAGSMVVVVVVAELLIGRALTFDDEDGNEAVDGVCVAFVEAAAAAADDTLLLSVLLDAVRGCCSQGFGGLRGVVAMNEATIAGKQEEDENTTKKSVCVGLTKMNFRCLLL
mmetsp:Transcript_15220/g.38685  ORF Transcript_15220/g.38685 Transcript_15220/m.38685 type:complete len:125 (-) Transcript_15220:92-466(-)